MIAQPHPNFLINDNIQLIEGSVTIILVVKATYLDGKKICFSYQKRNL